ncbi:MAG TPA: hypothetical protein VD969_03690 [Symbiobacteriaceae bacterium]|nr:hypothetical protein [Symbiobacteriaceae bacterium]
MNIPNEYLITIGEDSWMAKYVGSGDRFRGRFGFHPAEAAEQYPVPEGTLMVSPDRRTCQLITDAPPVHHYYRLQTF